MRTLHQVLAFRRSRMDGCTGSLDRAWWCAMTAPSEYLKDLCGLAKMDNAKLIRDLENWCLLANAAAYAIEGVRNTCILTSHALVAFLQLQGFEAEVFRARARARPPRSSSNGSAGQATAQPPGTGISLTAAGPVTSQSRAVTSYSTRHWISLRQRASVPGLPCSSSRSAGMSRRRIGRGRAALGITGVTATSMWATLGIPARSAGSRHQPHDGAVGWKWST